MNANRKTKERVQVYLSDKVYNDFCDYCDEEGLNQTKAAEKLLTIALSQQRQGSPTPDNYHKDIEDLKSRVSDLERIIRTNDYLDQRKIPQDAMRVEEQDF